MKRIVLTIALLILCSYILNAQMVVSDDETYTGESSSVMDIQSDTKGMLFPRNYGHNISDPADGLIVYDTESESYWYYKNSAWFELLTGGTATDRTTIDDDGYLTLEGDARAWDDLKVAVNSTTEGGSYPPTFAQFKNDGNAVSGSVGALHFMGSSQGDILDDGVYDLNLDHSIELWIKPNNSTKKNKRLIYKNDVFYLQYRKNGKLALKYDGLGWKQSTIQLNVGDWNYIVITMDDTGDERVINLYINNENAGSISSSSSITTNTNNIKLNSNNTNFELDNFAIWGKVFSDTELETGYNEGLGRILSGSEQDLNGYWRLDETSGSSFSDETSNNNNGSLSGTENTTFEWSDGHVAATSIASRGIYIFWFDPNEEEELHFSVQLPHKWSEGTDLLPHIHWVGDTIGSSGHDVSWGLEYTWINVGEVFGNTTIIYGTTTIYNETIVPDKHYITSLPTISATGKTISSMMICRIFRDSTSEGGTDDYLGKAGLLEIDFHYQIDAVGSKQEYVK